MALEAQEASSGQGGLGVSTCSNRPKPPSDFRGALSYNRYFCLGALQWFPLDSLNVPRGALSFPGKHSEVRSGRFSPPKLRFGSIIGLQKSDFGGSNTSRSRTKMRFSRPPHCFRCNGRPQHGFQSFPRHLSTATFSWGRRQWA